ncbi:hypothetical protein [Streptomyces sp. V1I1]|uniref:hypothetical protein n=1 Tax=Streptomyces sp. V1I1 TaxID=3042272 RepID=UPI00277F4353|nr:hypothetical protein [Streptomyces sp. V1I1]MDQ0938734.1 hypothetical protein [Streptomyces sp. V1I1]
MTTTKAMMVSLPVDDVRREAFAEASRFPFALATTLSTSERPSRWGQLESLRRAAESRPSQFTGTDSGSDGTRASAREPNVHEF